MNKYKICVYAISKNEEKFADRWMTSAKEADLIIVTDTGSDDATIEKLRKQGAVVYCEKIEPWRFDTARNIALNHVPEDTDICVSMDLDEVFESGWRDKLEASWTKDCTRARYRFVYSHNKDGSSIKQFNMEKIHRRHGFSWIHPVHEVLSYSGADKDLSIWVDGLVLHHYPDLTKQRSQYLSLLKLSSKENPQDDRTIFWLGREYFYHKKFDLCIETLKKHLMLESAKWNEERSASMRFIAMSYLAKKNITEAKAWIFRAIAECPFVREPYLTAARLGLAESNWSFVYAMALNGLKITEKTESYLSEPDCWGYELCDLAAISAFWLGLFDKSHLFAIMALEFQPDNLRLKNNLMLIEAVLDKNQGESIKPENYEKI